MSTFQQMPYEELNRWIAAAQGGQMAVDERQRRLLSGDATWLALKRAVEELSRIAPQDHDVVLRVGDLTVLEARYIEPHTFLFGGMADDGSHSWIVMHFSQVVFRVIHRAKRLQCLGIWSYLFEVGGILGAKHAAKTDAFVSAFLGQSGPSGAAKSFLVEV